MKHFIAFPPARRWILVAGIGVALLPLSLLSLHGQTTSSAAAPPLSSSSTPVTKPESHMTPAQARELFHSVDSILKFDSTTTCLPILRPVKGRLVTREEVEHYLMGQLHNDRDAKRLERSELVLKKFGLLDRDFALEPFLVQLLREQIAGYYDDKTKTVNLLDWIPLKEQKPVLAHELTHALQDQHVKLEKWDRQSDQGTAKNVAEDNRHISTDEADTVRDAVVEGQAMAVFLDYSLAPLGKNILTAPDVVARMEQAMSDNTNSPTLARAPLLLQQSLLFPYRDGLKFIRDVLAAKGKTAAFAGTLDHPPSSTYEIMTPQVYLKHEPVPLLRMPDIHPLIDAEYRPYDIGVMGEFDVRILAELFGGPTAGKALAPAWRGGIYYTAQSKQAKTSPEKDAVSSLALLYLSRWATPEAAQAFADIYAREIPRKYDQVTAEPASKTRLGGQSIVSRVWNTSEGPALIVVSGRTVFISESFPLDLAEKLELVMMGSISDSSGSEIVQSRERFSNSPQHDLTAALRDAFMTAAIPQVVRNAVHASIPESAIARHGHRASYTKRFVGARKRLRTPIA